MRSEGMSKPFSESEALTRSCVVAHASILMLLAARCSIQNNRTKRNSSIWHGVWDCSCSTPGARIDRKQGHYRGAGNHVQSDANRRVNDRLTRDDCGEPHRLLPEQIEREWMSKCWNDRRPTLLTRVRIIVYTSNGTTLSLKVTYHAR